MRTPTLQHIQLLCALSNASPRERQRETGEACMNQNDLLLQIIAYECLFFFLKVVKIKWFQMHSISCY